MFSTILQFEKQSRIGIRVQVPKTVWSIALLGFAVTYPLLLFILNYFIMRNRNSQNPCPRCKSSQTSNDTQHVSKKSNTKLYPAQLELLEFIDFHDALKLIRSLEWVHNTALYHSHLFIDDEEKSSLFDVKLLIDKLGGVVWEE